MQSLIRRSIAVVASAGVMTFLMAGGFPLGAQETGAAKSQSSKGKQKSKADNESPAESSGKAKSTGKTSPPDPTHRVPPGFGKLGLTAQQKEAIYKIQGKYYPRIQALEKQVEEMRSKRDAECEALLTPAQKRLLAEQEEERKAARKSSSAKNSEKSGA